LKPEIGLLLSVLVVETYEKTSTVFYFISIFIFFLFQDAFASERRKAKMLNFSIAYGKTPQGLSKDWKVP